MSAYDTFKAAILGDPFDANKKPSRQGSVQGFLELQTRVEALEIASGLGYPDFATTSAGLSGTEPGEGFSVFSSNFLSLYENNSNSTADLKGQIPLKSYVDGADDLKADQTSLDAEQAARIAADLLKIEQDDLDTAIIAETTNNEEYFKSALIAKRKTKNKSAKKGIIFASIGQSLSVRRDYTSGQPKVDWTSPYSYMIAGGADRNADADVAVNVTSFNADSVDYESLVRFEPGTTQAGKIDGFAMMTDCPTVCGIYALGARDYTQLRKGGSSLFVDFSMFLSQAVYLLKTDHNCDEIEIIFSFAHGEAETDNIAAGGVPGSATPTTKAQYKRYMSEWFSDIAKTCKIALDDLSFEPIFLMHQMGGVFNDDWLEIMRAQSEFGDENENVWLAGPTTPYGFQVDRVHPPGEAQALMGEFDWYLYKRAKAGLETCLKAYPFTRTGATIKIPHNYFEGSVEIGINAGNMTDASGFNSSGVKCIYGIEVLVDGTAVDITSVTPSGLTTTVVLAADPGASTVVVRMGTMETTGGLRGVPALTSRNNIKSEWSGIPSRYITSFTHQAWLLNDVIERVI